MQVAGQPYTQVLEMSRQHLATFISIHEDLCQGFKASATVLAVLQALAALAVTGLGIGASTQKHFLKVLNILTAFLGAAGAGCLPVPMV